MSANRSTAMQEPAGVMGSVRSDNVFLLSEGTDPCDTHRGVGNDRFPTDLSQSNLFCLTLNRVSITGRFDSAVGQYINARFV